MKFIKKYENAEEIARLQKQIEDLQKNDSEYFKNDALRNIKDISDADKIKWFDKTFKSALGYITQIEKDGYAREDNSHYAYEEFLEILISDRKTFWKYYNSISDN